ncbi:hypothetical protein HPP92_016000 [Vanilla planifolia]|uniref:Uncharacterized protein n=1 Tax=Vanilla planifolia TaxID=51239 RepID=A0A835QFB4_VANPL|nr:hypothetical protein HPP92_016000 [Vanilla planifolia]
MDDGREGEVEGGVDDIFRGGDGGKKRGGGGYGRHTEFGVAGGNTSGVEDGMGDVRILVVGAGGSDVGDGGSREQQRRYG